jgi:tRNA G26 N,N-dimethylase Trm1
MTIEQSSYAIAMNPIMTLSHAYYQTVFPLTSTTQRRARNFPSHILGYQTHGPKSLVILKTHWSQVN